MERAAGALSRLQRVPLCPGSRVRPVLVWARPDKPAEHVDHDHETGRVRGILCFAGNAAPGRMRDRPDALRRAADYVEGIVWKPT
ncbi:endonuclease domain-containing protein [Kitasatospora sp. NPDC008050]|uniref:endonuclease domain-containing protein n=1 Tax=Kitasatospora sp. NPDC008050 TaxID=3364021 RepID=UPI0036E9EB1E